MIFEPEMNKTRIVHRQRGGQCSSFLPDLTLLNTIASTLVSPEFIEMEDWHHQFKENCIAKE